MKKSMLPVAILLVGFSTIFVSCSKDDDDNITPQTITVDSSKPNGAFTAQKSGMFTAESGTPTKGTVQFGTDAGGTNFVHFTTDFITETATGTVSVYLSTSNTFTANPGNGNPDLQLVGPIQANGEHYFKLNNAPAAKFTHVILWCTTAAIPFGNAEVK